LVVAAVRLDRDGDTGDWTTVTAAGNLAVAKAKLSADPNVAAVSYVYTRHASDTRPLVPNDPVFRAGLESWLDASYFRSAWRVAATGRREIVAVIDSGVDLHQPDLRGRLTAGYDFIQNDNDPQDQLGHGTMVAGIIAAQAGNGYGIAGAAPNAMIMPLRVLDADGDGEDVNIVRAIHWAVDHGANVINMSFGGTDPDEFLDAAVAYATAHHVVVVAAAGNTPGPGISYPAASPGAIAVGAVDGRGQHASFSTTGSFVTITAPGVDITSLRLGGGVTTESGTSFASPMVAAAAALALGGGVPRADIVEQLCHRSRDAGTPGRDDEFGCGVLDAGAVVGAHLNLPLNTPVAVTVPDPVTAVTTVGINGAAVRLRWRWPADASTLAGMRVVGTPRGQLAVGVRPFSQDFTKSLAWNGSVGAVGEGNVWLPRAYVDWDLRLFAVGTDGRAKPPTLTTVAGVRVVLAPPRSISLRAGRRTVPVTWQAVATSTASGRKTTGRIAAMWVRSPSAGTWTTVPVIADAGGSVHYKTPLLTRYLLRIQTAPSGTSPGDTTTIVTVLPPARVSLTAYGTTSAGRLHVRMAGSVRLGKAGTAVWVQSLSTKGTWVTIATSRLRTGYVYRFTLTINGAGSRTLRVLSAATPTNAVGVSRAVTYLVR
jgi:subtilisin family serine protease